MVRTEKGKSATMGALSFQFTGRGGVVRSMFLVEETILDPAGMSARFHLSAIRFILNWSVIIPCWQNVRLSLKLLSGAVLR